MCCLYIYGQARWVVKRGRWVGRLCLGRCWGVEVLRWMRGEGIEEYLEMLFWNFDDPFGFVCLMLLLGMLGGFQGDVVGVILEGWFVIKFTNLTSDWPTFHG